MPFARPVLKTIIDRNIADINSRLPEGDARLSTSILNVLAYVNAGAVHGLYGYLDWQARQLMVDTCETEYLDRWASVWGVYRKPASPAIGTVQFTGNSEASIPAGTLLQRSDGQQYQTTSEVALVSNGSGSSSASSSGSATHSASANVIAMNNGVVTNTVAASTLNLISPIAGVTAETTVDKGGLTGGSDIEVDPSLRARLLARIQTPPHGGAYHDYINWALEVPGVTRAWLYPEELGAGTVTLRFMRDNDDDIIPSTTAVAEVQEYIDSRRPVTAQLTVVAPIGTPIDFKISAVSPNTSAVRSAIHAELANLLTREALPGGSILLSHIRAAISAASGEHDHVLVEPSDNIVNTTGKMSTMGVITWL